MSTVVRKSQKNSCRNCCTRDLSSCQPESQWVSLLLVVLGCKSVKSRRRVIHDYLRRTHFFQIQGLLILFQSIRCQIPIKEAARDAFAEWAKNGSSDSCVLPVGFKHSVWHARALSHHPEHTEDDKTLHTNEGRSRSDQRERSERGRAMLSFSFFKQKKRGEAK